MNFSEMDDSKKKMLIFAGIGAGVFLLLIIVVTVVALGNQGGEQTAQEPTPEESSTGSSGNSGTKQGIPEITEDDLKEEEEDEASDEADTRESGRRSIFSTPIMEVGEETLYWRDYVNKENSMSIREDADKELIEKEITRMLVEESLYLQEGLKNGIIEELGDTIYNNPTKDYDERTSNYLRVRGVIESEVAGISGGVVSLWFYNDGFPAEMGYEKGKEAAIEIMTRLQKRVESGEMTISEAGDSIRDNPKFEQIDRAYKANAYMKFAAKPEGEPITNFSEFDTQLRQLAEGEVTDIYVGKSRVVNIKDDIIREPTDETIEAVVLFGKVNTINTSGYTTPEDWLKETLSSYKLTRTDEFEALLNQ